ncbi:uncharacterized protein LOC143888262 isoform X2 [Tasmannia lanceolata]|uniref:uncharacterized protein LOC143888262 isoform X2 n=1 Tax=Tasmannia lanceolata TaxID=3420 RepID=UPI0040627CA0
MESSYSSWDYIYLIILRPILAIVFILSLIFLSWYLAWKLVLVHVPIVQEICGMRKKPSQPKPATRRLSRYYNTVIHNSPSGPQICRNNNLGAEVGKS